MASQPNGSIRRERPEVHEMGQKAASKQMSHVPPRQAFIVQQFRGDRPGPFYLD